MAEKWLLLLLYCSVQLHIRDCMRNSINDTTREIARAPMCLCVCRIIPFVVFHVTNEVKYATNFVWPVGARPPSRAIFLFCFRFHSIRVLPLKSIYNLFHISISIPWAMHNSRCERKSEFEPNSKIMRLRWCAHDIVVYKRYIESVAQNNAHTHRHADTNAWQHNE